MMHDGRIFRVYAENAVLPDGSVKSYEVVRHPGGAAAVVVDERGRVCLLKQWRHAVGGWIIELPAGKMDVAGETPQETATRELAEEAGITASSWRSLGTILSSPGFCDEVLHLFLATGLSVAASALGDGEFIEVFWLDFTGALDMARRGEITDAKTVAGLFRASGLVQL